MFRSELDLSTLQAIDSHVHVEMDQHGTAALPSKIAEAASKYFKSEGPVPDIAGIASYYRQRRMAAVVFTVDARTQFGRLPISSVEIARHAADQADVLIPFASVDPRTGEAAIETLRSLVIDHGARGVKLHPTVQGFDPADERYRPLWLAIRELGIPAIVHTGQTGIGAGLPGGAGLRLQYSNPMLLDEVLADIPGLQLVFAHPSVPWQDEAISIATHKPEVRIDLSGWRPKYTPPQLLRAATTFLQDRVLFGSDFPLITPDRWLADFDEIEMSPAVRRKLLLDNAITMLGLESTPHPLNEGDRTQ